MTQEAADVQELIDQVGELVNAAYRVQEIDDERSAKQALGRLDAAYHEWREEAYSFLPKELVQPFDEEYESSVQGWRVPWKISHFLMHARTPSDPRHFPASATTIPKWQADAHDCFERPIIEQKRLLSTAKIRNRRGPMDYELLDRYVAIFRRMSRVVTVLTQAGHEKRPGLAHPRDEYDVQRIVLAIFTSLVNDVDPEAWLDDSVSSTPRTDFLLRDEGVAVEVKFVHEHTTIRRLGKEINDDIRRYGADDRVKAMLFVVYDPHPWIAKKDGFEAVGNEVDSRKPVRVVVAQ